MRLALFASEIPASLLEVLQQHGIKTEIDLLFSASTFDIYKRLPPGTVSFQDLKRYTTLVAERCSAKSVCASDLLSDSQQGSTVLTNVDALDEMLGRFLEIKVLEISGDRGSGKTVFALNVLLHHLIHNPKDSALWVDTKGGFSADNAAHIVASYGIQAPAQVLERLRVCLAFDIETIYTLLERFNSEHNDDTSPVCNLRLLVIDAITPLFGPLLSAFSSQGHAMMIGLMRQLRVVSQTFSVLVIVINDTAATGPISQNSGTTSARKPALGSSFAYMTDATLWLSRKEINEERKYNPSTHVATLLRSRTAVGPSILFSYDLLNLLPSALEIGATSKSTMGSLFHLIHQACYSTHCRERLAKFLINQKSLRMIHLQQRVAQLSTFWLAGGP